MLPFATAGSYSGIMSSLCLVGLIQTVGSCCVSSTDVPLREAAGPRDVGLYVLEVRLDSRSILVDELDALSEDLLVEGSVGVADPHDLSDAVVELSTFALSNIFPSSSVFV